MLLRALQRFVGVLSQRFLSVSASPERGNSLEALNCFSSVMGACSSYCVRAHGWVARICQPWEQSSSRSWLPIVEVPGCLRHPTSTLNSNLKKSPTTTTLPSLTIPKAKSSSRQSSQLFTKIPCFQQTCTSRDVFLSSILRHHSKSVARSLQDRTVLHHMAQA